MNYIKLDSNQKIDLLPKEGATPTQAINSAIEFRKENNLFGCTLEYKGFTMYIDNDSDLKQLVNEYSDWEAHQRTELSTF